MSRFAGLKAAVPVAVAPSPANESEGKAKAATSREGKRLLGGHFSPAVSRGLKQLALDEGTTVQALMGEALDLLMRDRGKHPFGER